MGYHADMILSADILKRYVRTFNADDEELYVQHIPNDEAAGFLSDNVPLFECPDEAFELCFYFRWWTFRKHIKLTRDGYVITEFLPSVGWAGKHNTISCAAGHHFYEGRWLHDRHYLDDYARFWLRKGGNPRNYSVWIADALLAYSKVSGDRCLAVDLLPDLVSNDEAWEQRHRDTNGLYWQVDDRDGMECSISGRLAPDNKGYRATINSYMFGDASAIAQIAAWAGRDDLAHAYRLKAAEIRRLTEAILWDEKAGFFKVLPRKPNPNLADVRELHGYTPWYFNLPGTDKSIAWAQLMDVQGFYAPFGPTTAEQRHPEYKIAYEGHECMWNGPSWPFATSSTLTALANLLNGDEQDVIGKTDYFELLRIYTRCHQRQREDGKGVPWIDENINPYTGDWIARTRLRTWANGTWSSHKGGVERGKDYNHSTYNDLIITGLVGLRPRVDDVVEINPLLPDDAWDWFCLDNVNYHGVSLTILWDRTGRKYGQGKGLRVFADGSEIAASATLQRIELTIRVADKVGHLGKFIGRSAH